MGKYQLRKKGKYLPEKARVAEEFAQDLRKRMTPAEKKFKKNLSKTSIRFKTQKIIYKKKSFYIIDFYIPEKLLCIELDGGYHLDEEQRKKDEERDKFLVKNGYVVWRMTNEEAVNLTVEDISDKIKQYPSKEFKVVIAPTIEEPVRKYFPKKKKKRSHRIRPKKAKKKRVPNLPTPNTVLDRKLAREAKKSLGMIIA